MFAIIDCGSTATRIFLLRDNDVIAKKETPNGVNLSASSGNNQLLKQMIAACLSELLQENNFRLEDIRFAIASGMITSNLGLKEIPHLVAPVAIDDLAKFARQYNDMTIFPLPIPVVFIPGIKNNIGTATWENMRSMDLMRGEETQAIGVLARYKPELPCTIIELGSTTKIIHIDRAGRIAGSITSLSGQVYGAVLKETFIGSSVKLTDGQSDIFSPEILQHAWQSVQNSGLLRTILLTRFIQFSLNTTAADRKLFCESAIAADDMKLIDDAKQYGFDLTGEIILVGNENRCRIYHYMIEHSQGISQAARQITAREDIDRLVIDGANYIANRLAITVPATTGV